MLQILIVDDDKNTRRYLAAVLSEAGYYVSVFQFTTTNRYNLRPVRL